MDKLGERERKGGGGGTKDLAHLQSNSINNTVVGRIISSLEVGF